MQRFLVALVVLLSALLLAREPAIERADRFFLDWLLRNTQPSGQAVPLTIIDIHREPLAGDGSTASHAPSSSRTISSDISPLEFALFFQSILDFHPTILAIEPVLKWREGDRDQEQIFLDQAMRIPKLFLAAELTSTPDPDLPPPEIAGFQHVTGRRGDLPTFTGVAHQPNEDLRLISTLAYINLPEDVADETHVPLLFHYRGEVIPAFALQVFLTWARIPMSQVNIVLGSHIMLPGGRKIPLNPDGSLTINPNASKLARRMTLNELLLLTQQQSPGGSLPALHDLILARTPEVIKPDDSPQISNLRSAGILASAIASLQSDHFVRRVPVAFDCIVLLLIAALGWPALRLRRPEVVLYGIAFAAAYCLLGFGAVARYGIAVPGIAPLGAIALLTILALISPRKKRVAAAEVAVPPPAL
jgi:hypothetical protein